MARSRVQANENMQRPINEKSSSVYENESQTLRSKSITKCFLCNKQYMDENEYGMLCIYNNNAIVHYFCALSSSGIIKNGADEDGIYGFLLTDIEITLERASRVLCCYCNEPGATISCSEIKCNKIFHLPCGLEHGSMHQYFEPFKSFCHKHRVTQSVGMNQLLSSTPVQCAICLEDTLPTPSLSSLWAPCCNNNTWFHRKCIQELALNTDHYSFKCPLCGSVDLFTRTMLTLGIYIPLRDDSCEMWEPVSTEFLELYKRHTSCDAKTCYCPYREKRNFHQEIGPWEIRLCPTCGSNGTHILCSSIKVNQVWFCAACRYIGVKRKQFLN